MSSILPRFCQLTRAGNQEKFFLAALDYPVQVIEFYHRAIYSLLKIVESCASESIDSGKFDKQLKYDRILVSVFLIFNFLLEGGLLAQIGRPNFLHKI